MSKSTKVNSLQGIQGLNSPQRLVFWMVARELLFQSGAFKFHIDILNTSLTKSMRNVNNAGLSEQLKSKSAYLSQQSFLNAPFHQPSEVWIIICIQVGTYDGRTETQRDSLGIRTRVTAAINHPWSINSSNHADTPQPHREGDRRSFTSAPRSWAPGFSLWLTNLFLTFRGRDQTLMNRLHVSRWAYAHQHVYNLQRVSSRV